MKKALALFTVLLFLFSLAACGNAPAAKNIAGKTYLYEKKGFGGEFTVSLDENGTFTWYEGFFSSYICHGEWTLEDDILTLTETSYYNSCKPLVHCFRVKGDTLIFSEELTGTDRFFYLTVEDGAKFTAMDKKTEQK